MPEDSRRGRPRAKQVMIDVFHAIAGCDDLVHYWDVAKHAGGGVLLRASSQERFPTEDAALQVAHTMAVRLRPAGYDARTLNAEARANGSPGDGWQASVEVLVGAPAGTVTS